MSVAPNSATDPDLVEFRPADAGESPARDLIAAMEAEMSKLYDGFDLNDPRMPDAGSHVFSSRARGGFLVGWRDGAAVAAGGFKDLHADEACEIKRMYVTPEARGGTVGRQLLQALEAAAREAGYQVARLDTGPRQEAVARLYRSAGYRDTDNFNGNIVATYFGEKRLTDPAEPCA